MHLPSGNRALPPAYIWIPASAVAVLMALPLVYLVVRTAAAGTDALDLLLTARSLGIFLRTIALMALVTAACVAMGVSLAWLTVRSDLPARRLFGVLTSLPLVIPSYVFAWLVAIALGPKGMLQTWVEPLGVERLPSIYGLPGATLTLALLSFPYVMLPVKAALHRVDPAMEEAARSLGRSGVRTFLTVTLPLLRPAITAGALLAALYTMSDFGAVSLLRYETLTWAIFIQYETAFDRSIAAVLSLALVALALTILFLESRTRGSATYHRVTPGTQRRTAVVALGPWRWPAAVYASLVVFLSLAAPMGILGYWAIRGLAAGEQLDLVWTNAFNTVMVSGLAALAAAVAALPIAVLAIRYPGRIVSALERLSYVGFALPGLAIALAFVFLASSLLTPLYQTIFLLVTAYVVLYLPASVGATESSLKQISPRVEEAARGLGKTSFEAFRLVTLPLLTRGIAAGAALVFLLTMKELPATLVLSPSGFQTLATSVWGAASEAFFARAAVPALLLVLAAGFPMAYLVLREDRGR